MSEERDRPATRRRGAELENAILDAAWEVLAEHGYHGFTYEAVAARAGTSRPVLYRRWAQREELLRAAVSKHWNAHPIEVPDTGSLRDDAIGLLRNVEAGHAQMITLLSLQLTDYFRETDSSFSDLRAMARGAARPNVFEVLIGRAVERGELARQPDSARVINLPFDLVRHDSLLTLRPVPEQAIIEIIDEVWLPLLHALEPTVVDSSRP